MEDTGNLLPGHDSGMPGAHIPSEKAEGAGTEDKGREEPRTREAIFPGLLLLCKPAGKKMLTGQRRPTEHLPVLEKRWRLRPIGTEHTCLLQCSSGTPRDVRAGVGMETVLVTLVMKRYFMSRALPGMGCGGPAVVKRRLGLRKDGDNETRYSRDGGPSPARLPAHHV